MHRYVRVSRKKRLRRKKMKTITNLFLMIALTGTIAMADGDMGTGGYQPCTVNCPPPPCTENCTGGQAVPSDDSSITSLNAAGVTPENVIIVLANEYLGLGFQN